MTNTQVTKIQMRESKAADFKQGTKMTKSLTVIKSKKIPTLGIQLL
jgi:hypothetical protein